MASMNRQEAEELAARLQAEHEDRATHRFFPRDSGDGSWSVAKVLMPERLRNRPLQTTTEARPRPPYADDGRGGHERRAPGLPGGLGS